MVTISPVLNTPQARFFNLDKKFRAFVAGFGSGKTWVGSSAMCGRFWRFPKVNQGYFAPTYPQIRDIFFPTIEEVAFNWGLKAELRESNKEVHFYEGKIYRGTTICRSMDKPATIIGFKIGHALVDELDTLTKEKARAVWRKVIGRLRYNIPGLINGVDVATTPEGFRFVYEQFVKAVRESPALGALYGLVQASTYDNAANLPPDYISSLFASYPPELIKAYLNGQFVNLAAGTVYNCFDREANSTIAEMRAGERLHIGMDFNVLKMAAVVYVLRNGIPYAVDELVDVRDTPSMCALIKERYPDHQIDIYPDASGQNTSSKDWSKSDLSIIRNAGFSVNVGSTNPAVKDRINATNAMLLNGNNERRMFINPYKCPRFTEALEQQAYDKNGTPDKSSGIDHIIDAGTYPIIKLFPINRPTYGRRDL
jgi:hypothetical protein